MRTLVALSLALLCVAADVSPNNAFDAAGAAASSLDFAHARELYRVAAKDDPDPKQRALAALKLANIEWRIDHDLAAAEKDLALVPEESEEAAAAWIERAKLNAEVRGDFAEAGVAATHAMSVAKDDLTRGRAMYLHAVSIIEPVLRARLDGRCEGDPAELTLAENEFGTIVERAGPLPELARSLLDAALLANDGPKALAAWRGYYGSIAGSAVLAPAAATLATRLPAWQGVEAAGDERRAVGSALADSRFFDEAALVLRDPCAKHAIEGNDLPVAETVAYARTMRSLRRETDEYYRNVALHRAAPDVLRGIVDHTGHALWPQLSWKGKPGAYSDGELTKYLERRFGAYITLGNTSNVFDLHAAHTVVDEERQVTQYGRTASLRFIALDGIVSNGFSMWIHEGRSGDGGWAKAAIYQVRPMYVSGPFVAWLRTTDPAQSVKRDREIEEETRRDDQRIARDPTQLPHGVAMRMERQYQVKLLADLRASGLSGGALRDAFVSRMTTDTFESSIWAHEGRHAIDKKYLHWLTSPELEFRAKLSEVAFAPAPRTAAEAISADVPPTSPHGSADRRIGEALIAWMRKHSAEIPGLDASKPMLIQLDKLNDDQLRVAFRSIDPWAPK